MAGIVGLAGQPRSGKSYTSIELFVLPALKEGRLIVTNLPLKMPEILQDYPAARVQFIESLEKQDWSDIGHGCLLILDEIWRLWPQGKQMKAIPESQLALLKEHGHRSDENGRSMDVVLISQDMGDIAAPIRKLIETSIITVKHLDLGKENAAIRYYCRKAATLADDNRPPKSQIIKSENIVYRPEVYRYYKTHMHAVSDASPDETRMVKSSWFHSFQFRAGLALFVFCVGYFIYGLNQTIDYVKQEPAKPGKPTRVVQSVTDNVNPTVAEAVELPKKATYSGKWRIGGFIYNYGKTGQRPVYILVSQSKAQRKIFAEDCRHDGLEVFCDVDGEVVTWFSGRESVGYLAGGNSAQGNAEQPKPVEQSDGRS
ncbi:zonular occludens toxin domain-containing protein [Methylomonas sp. TEB]|uniref:zonular occludens toxin domain-containing protein n=1 Tax=Methylomonas sp. TEB TaxID=3398229 RepID=UPI0039F57D35